MVKEICLRCGQVYDHNSWEPVDDNPTSYSWEVDALPPEVLNELISSEIEKRLDIEKYNKVIREEEREKKTLREFGKQFDDTDDSIDEDADKGDENG